MPDLTHAIFYHCVSAEHFVKEVVGSQGDKHTVRYEETPRGPYQYDYTCTCKSFKFRKTCKHIDAVKKSGEHCNWLQFIEGGQPVEKNGKSVVRNAVMKLVCRHGEFNI